MLSLLLVTSVGAAPPAPLCAGDYADDLAAMSERARTLERDHAPYTFCVRTTATYECPAYGPDGTLHAARHKVSAHGTAFGLRRDGTGTLLVTNQHVAEWPAVTDAEHAIDGVPPGCRRVDAGLRLVDDEADAYDRDDIPLAKVVADAQLDVAVLRATAALPVVPWKRGRSAALRDRNAVSVRGFPLGVLRATNVGKVVSARERDEERDWSHDDFVIDALLSPGNSGSPVFAVSCRTGEPELVGVYHAAYVKGSALNVVVGIDQLEGLLTTLAPPAPRPRPGAVVAAPEARRELAAALVPGAEPSYFRFGALAAAVRLRGDGALVFQLMPPQFPARSRPALVVEDVPRAAGEPDAVRLWAGNRQGLVPVDPAALDGDARGLVSAALEALRGDALLGLAFDQAARVGTATRARFQELARLERAVDRNAVAREELSDAVVELAQRLCPESAEAPVTLAEIVAPPSADPAPALADAAPSPPARLPPGLPTLPAAAHHSDPPVAAATAP